MQLYGHLPKKSMFENTIRDNNVKQFKVEFAIHLLEHVLLPSIKFKFHHHDCMFYLEFVKNAGGFIHTGDIKDNVKQMEYHAVLSDILYYAIETNNYIAVKWLLKNQHIVFKMIDDVDSYRNIKAAITTKNLKMVKFLSQYINFSVELNNIVTSHNNSIIEALTHGSFPIFRYIFESVKNISDDHLIYFILTAIEVAITKNSHKSYELQYLLNDKTPDFVEQIFNEIISDNAQYVFLSTKNRIAALKLIENSTSNEEIKTKSNQYQLLIL